MDEYALDRGAKVAASLAGWLTQGWVKGRKADGEEVPV